MPTNHLQSSIDIVQLAKKQHALDKFIRDKNDLGESNLHILVNAYFVEISEFLNEVRAFKNWSKKGLTTETAYEEYIDGLHFLLSIANDRWDLYENVAIGEQFQREIDYYYKTFLNKKYIYDENNPKSIERFIEYSLRLYSYNLICESDLSAFIGYFNLYLTIAYSLGMTPEQIATEYAYKHEINYARQENGTY